MKKITSIALMLVMMLALAVPALAADVTINVRPSDPADTNPAGETYTVYKIFDATVNGEIKQENVDATHPQFANVSYSIDGTSPFFSVIENFTTEYENAEGQKVTGNAFTLTQVNSTTKYVVTMAHSYDAAALADALKAVITDETPTAYEGGSPIKLENNKGYYLILSSLGSKAVVDTVGKEDMAITTKNSFPTLTKKITAVTPNGNANDNVNATASYGSTVEYTITVVVPASANGPITVHDKMDEGLEFVAFDEAKSSFTPNADDIVKNSADGCTMEFDLNGHSMAGETITIVYTAKVKDGVDTAKLMPNTAHLTYSNYSSTPDTVTVTTYEFDLVKTTSNGTLLDGATFKLYNAATEGTAYTFTYDAATKTYSYNAAGTVTDLVVEDGMVTVKGLAAGKYYLEETVTPDGYNTLTERQEVNLAGNSKANIVDGKAETGKGEIVVNLTGAELPSTGGIGTTIFYVVGGLLVVGAGVMLVTKKRVSDQEQ